MNPSMIRSDAPAVSDPVPSPSTSPPRRSRAGVRAGVVVVAVLASLLATVPFAGPAAASSAPVSVAAPVVSGAASVGSTLSVSPGSWTPSGVSLSVQWLHCPYNCTLIPGATGWSYTLQAGDGGKFVAARVTATNASGSSYALSNVVNVAAAPVAPKSFLASGEILGSGTQLVSPDGSHVLRMQSDGNLVVYAPGNRPIWASGTNGRIGSIVRMQSDGNLVVYAPGNVAVWNSGTHGNPGSVLRMQSDGNLVVYAPGNRPIWASKSVAPPQSTVGGRISRSEVLLRARDWIHFAVPYDVNRTAPDRNGRRYRTDCSGFVSMALHLTSSPSTVGLGSSSLTTPIAVSNLQPGDIMNVPLAGPSGHVRLFLAWTNTARTSYRYLDMYQTGRPVREAVGSISDRKSGRLYEARRYNNIF
jgi:hypothetical protein